MSDIEIELTDAPAACRAAEELQRAAWGMADRGIVPAEHIRAATHNGGVLLLARRDGRPVGFCYGFVGLEDGEPILCSHMLAVRPEEQSQGIGRALKQAQHAVARERGFTTITWTFDPLQARNAHLNLHRLGAYADRYHVDHYGPMDDEINAGLPTDRLLAVWPVRDPAPQVTTDDATWLLTADTSGRFPVPGEPAPAAHGPALVAVPRRLDAMRAEDPDLVLRWRVALRTALGRAFDAGLVAVDLHREAHDDDVAAYVLGARR